MRLEERMATLFVRSFGAAAIAVSAAVSMPADPASAQPRYDVGASDTEIRIGNIMSYTGPIGPNGKVLGGTMAAYFEMINAEGGINGRRIRFISYDNGYDPAKALEPVRKLVEEDKVLFLFAPFGSQPNVVVRDYMNKQGVPQLFALSGANTFADPIAFPWTMGWQPNYQAEGRIYAQYLLEHHPDAKIAVVYQDDELGKDYLRGLEDGLAGKIPIVARETFSQVRKPDLRPQMTKLKNSGATVLLSFALNSGVIESIRQKAELGWKPVHIISSVAFIEPVGMPGAEGLLSAAFLKNPADPAWRNDPGFRKWSAFMDRYYPSGDKKNVRTAVAYSIAQTLVEVLKQAGDDLTRKNIMKQAANLKNLQLDMALPGVLINTSARDFAPYEQMRMWRFTGNKWELFGPVRSGVDPGAVSESFKAIFQYGGATRQSTRTASNANTVTMMTGTFSGTYVQIGADLATVLDDGTDLRMLPIVGRGSVQAIADILFLRGVDMGIVRTDTLDYLETKGYASNIKERLAYITKLYNEEMHIIAPKTVRSLRDLDGRTVAVDSPDSGTFVTAITVFERLGLKPHFLYVEPRLALEMLRNGEIDAVISVEGKPLSLVEQIDDPNLHLVGVEYSEPLRQDYLPAQFTAADYPKLIPPGGRVDTIAASAILATYNWPSDTDRFRRVANFVDRFFERINEFKKPPFHPKWGETIPQVALKDWVRFQPAQAWLDKNSIATPASPAGSSAASALALDNLDGADDELRSAFLKFLDDRPRPTGGRNKPRGTEDRQALFEEFLRWRRVGAQPAR
jgi:branched-chain amino acid transport system substrate-binding protein